MSTLPQNSTFTGVQTTGNPRTAESLLRDLTKQHLSSLDLLMQMWWETAEEKGFHDDLKNLASMADIAHVWGGDAAEVFDTLVALFVSQKLALISDEVSEAHEEARSGNLRRGIYWKCDSCGRTIDHADYQLGTIEGDEAPEGSYACNEPMDHPIYRCAGTMKPEGFEVELADAIIRIGDLAKIAARSFPSPSSLTQAIAVKAAFNRSRPYKHGRKY